MASYPGRSPEGGAFEREHAAPDNRTNDSSRYYHTADTRLRERAVGEMSMQADVGRSPNYDFTPPAPQVEPGGRP